MSGGTETSKDGDLQPAPREPRRHRPIRSFVLREGRLTAGQQRAFAELWPRFGCDWQPGSVLDLPALFGNHRQVLLEIGFGNGETFAQMAEADPARNYLGLEVHRPGVGHLLLEIERRGLDNARVMRQDAIELLSAGLAPASLAGVHLFFPDPWPKKRHHKRRIVQPALAVLLARVIRPGGVFHAATDWTPYAEHMLQVLEASPDFRNASGAGSFAERSPHRPMTKFEQRGTRLGHSVHDLIFVRR
ncbi:MAG: tRNA (guanosine(46)-N7)-methyltransferase TrmB [Thiohalocapsa sp.]|nr:tRNA (guanosine(46)-N7)-methyltransferase TrmB [Thiohalocapsa sp.]